MEKQRDLLIKELEELENQIKKVNTTISNILENENKKSIDIEKDKKTFEIDKSVQKDINKNLKNLCHKFELEYEDYFSNLNIGENGVKLKVIIDLVRELGLGEFNRLKHNKLIREGIIDKPQITDKKQNKYYRKDIELAFFVQLLQNLNSQEFRVIMDLLNIFRKENPEGLSEFMLRQLVINKSLSITLEGLEGELDNLINVEWEFSPKHGKNKKIKEQFEEELDFLYINSQFQNQLNKRKSKHIKNIQQLLEKLKKEEV